MSLHAIPDNIDAQDWYRLVKNTIREPSGIVYANGNTVTPSQIEFTPDLTPEETTTYHTLAAAETVRQSAKAQAQSIPNWASWTEAEALAWHDTNIANALPVANLSAANTLLSRLEQENRALIRMVIALRNQAWSDLQDG